MGYLKKSITLLFLFLALSCEKEIDWKIKKDNQDVLIVDAIITNEFKPQKINLSHSYQELNAIARPYTGANVFISDGTNTFQFTEGTNDQGNYYSKAFRALTDKTYHLTIETGSTTYSSSAAAVPVTPLKKITIDKSEGPRQYFYVYSESPSPSMTEVNYDWSFDSDYCNFYGYCYATEIYYTLNNIDVGKTFKPDKQMIKFPVGTTIIRKTFGLTEEHQAFLRSLLMETEWRGGLFDVQQGNVNTNITNGAKGFFAVCMVVSDTTVIQ
jgi:hypothetical protein